MAIKRCKASFAAAVRGVPRVMAVGDLVNDTDPIIRGREHLFEDVEVHVQERSRIEEATADPGRRRSLSRAARPATRKAAVANANPKPKAEDKGLGASQDAEPAEPQKGVSS